MLMLDDTRAREWRARAHQKYRTPAWRRNHRLSEAVVGDVPGEDFKCIDVDLESTIGTSAAIKINYELEVLKLLFRD